MSAMDGSAEEHLGDKMGWRSIPPLHCHRRKRMKRIILIIAALILIGSLSAGCKEKTEEAPAAKEEMAEEQKPPAGKKVVMIIAPENFRDEELFEPKSILEDRGVKVGVASASLDTAAGMLGGKAKPDMLISDIKVEEWDAVVLVGGSGASRYWEDTTIHAMLNQAVEQDKVIGAICIAPVTLANAGILSGKKATVYNTEMQKLADKGAQCTNKNVQRDGNIITANGPTAAAFFAHVIAQALKEQR
jgi:protease I